MENMKDGSITINGNILPKSEHSFTQAIIVKKSYLRTTSKSIIRIIHFNNQQGHRWSIINYAAGAHMETSIGTKTDKSMEKKSIVSKCGLNGGQGLFVGPRPLAPRNLSIYRGQNIIG